MAPEEKVFHGLPLAEIIQQGFEGANRGKSSSHKGKRRRRWVQGYLSSNLNLIPKTTVHFPE
jgi:hypothetical protein